MPKTDFQLLHLDVSYTIVVCLHHDSTFSYIHVTHMMTYLLANACPCLRLRTQELVSTIIQEVDVEDPVINAASNDSNSAMEEAIKVQAKPVLERTKIVISIQEKDSQKQIRVYKVHYYGALKLTLLY